MKKHKLGFLFYLSNRTVLFLTSIYMVSIFIYTILRMTGFSISDSFNANIIGLFFIMFSWMVYMLRFIDENKKSSEKTKLMGSAVLVFQLISYAIAIMRGLTMITPSLIER